MILKTNNKWYSVINYDTDKVKILIEFTCIIVNNNLKIINIEIVSHQIQIIESDKIFTQITEFAFQILLLLNYLFFSLFYLF